MKILGIYNFYSADKVYISFLGSKPKKEHLIKNASERHIFPCSEGAKNYFASTIFFVTIVFAVLTL